MLRLASCGNDCNVCPRYIATRAGNAERLREVAELWFRLGLRDTLPSADEMACYGCSSMPWCRHGIRECAQEKGVDNCGQCQEYPCQTVQITQPGAQGMPGKDARTRSTQFLNGLSF